MFFSIEQLLIAILLCSLYHVLSLLVVTAMFGVNLCFLLTKHRQSSSHQNYFNNEMNFAALDEYVHFRNLKIEHIDVRMRAEAQNSIAAMSTTTTISSISTSAVSVVGCAAVHEERQFHQSLAVKFLSLPISLFYMSLTDAMAGAVWSLLVRNKIIPSQFFDV